jgi:adenylate cyclase
MGDWAAAGLLDELDDRARRERVELLDWLEAQGFDDEQIREAHQEGLLVFLAAERVVMGGPAALTPREVSAQSGTELELLQEFRRAQGLPVPDPDARHFSEAEAGVAALPQTYAALGFDRDQMLAITRVLGRGLSQAAQVMRTATLEVTIQPGASERELAERYAATVESVLPHVAPLLELTLRQHLRNMVRAEGVEAAERLSGRAPGAHDVTVAFADLVGFTRLGEAVDPSELGAIADRLGALATAVAEPPVTFVKQLGDGVMLVAPEAPALLQTTFALVAAVESEGEGFPQVRVGLACGPAVARGGDWFGRPVNLASRVSSIARAGSVLCTAAVHDAVADDDQVRWSRVGARAIKGVHGPVRLVRARPGGGAAS